MEHQRKYSHVLMHMITIEEIKISINNKLVMHNHDGSIIMRKEPKRTINMILYHF